MSKPFAAEFTPFFHTPEFSSGLLSVIIFQDLIITGFKMHASDLLRNPQCTVVTSSEMLRPSDLTLQNSGGIGFVLPPPRSLPWLQTDSTHCLQLQLTFPGLNEAQPRQRCSNYSAHSVTQEGLRDGPGVLDASSDTIRGVSWVRCLLNKHEDLSSQDPH